MTVFPIVAVAAIVMIDVLAIASTVYLSDKQQVRVRWGDLIYIHVMKWFFVGVFVSTAQGGDNIFSVIAIFTFSLFNWSRLTGTLNAIGNSTAIIDIALISNLEKVSVALALLSCILLGVANTIAWMVPYSSPLMLSGILFIAFINSFKYCSDPGFRTWSNLLYFQLMFDNRK